MLPPLRRVLELLLATVLALLYAPAAQAKPAYKEALAEYFGPFLAKKLYDCRTCHLPAQEGEVRVSKPHNAFGARLKAVRDELRKAGKDADIAARLDLIAEEDSDGDGVSNLLELLGGHFPGDATDKPTEAELAEVRAKLPEFARFRAAYPWRPFHTVQRPTIPQVKNTGWVRNPIDAFLAKEHEERGLKPRPEASRAVLLRRVTLDLTGLPPTPEELHAFLDDPAADAYEKVVDRLLASPRYGERWGRHWMDVWRYSDWAGWGAQVRDSQPHIWRWRDWIVEAVNKDKGYDRMVLEMLAADELAPEDTDALRATGYLVRNFKLLSREQWMQDTVEHTSQAFLGITLACARCHDHLFDPLLQKEYYRVRAVFEPYQVRLDRLPGQPDTMKDGLPRVYDATLDVPTYLYLRGDERTPDKTALVPGVPAVLGGAFGPIEPVTLPLAAYAPDRRPFVIQESLAASAAEVAKARAALADADRTIVVAIAAALVDRPGTLNLGWARAQQALQARALAQANVPAAESRDAALKAILQVEQLEEDGKQGTPEWTQAATETTTAQRQAALREARRNLLAARQAHVAALAQTRPETAKKVADAELSLTKAEADVQLPPGPGYTKRGLPAYPKTSTGRRLAFARWIASRDNPLTARVAMNHLWLRHFGQALVPSVFDFGRNGRLPSHPALLDWLAAEFVERNWSMKALHRLMVSSSVYRMASTPDDADLALDRDNRFLWRMNPRRLEAEAVRDSVFFVAGRLDPTMGGPDIPHQQGLTVPRRSLYFQHAAEKEMEFLKIFDGPAVNECYRRKESVVPQQALALVNNEMTLKQARLLARELADRTGADGAVFATAAFERVLSRPPTAEETAECVTFLRRQAERYSESKPAGAVDTEGRLPATEPALRARENLVHVLLNHNDFVTVR